MPEVIFYADVGMTVPASPGEPVAAACCAGKWLRIDAPEYRPTFTGQGQGWESIHYGRVVADSEAEAWGWLFAQADQADPEGADQAITVEAPHGGL